VAALPHSEPLSGESYSAVELGLGNDEVILLDQRLLPEQELYLRLRSVEHVAEGISRMVVRGAPAIGITAAYGLVLAAAGGREALAEAARLLGGTRPTAVNLAWAIERMLVRAARESGTGLREALAEEARAIHREDVLSCRAMGKLGAEYVPDGATILTHCNAGALATGGYGTALGVIRAAHEAGKRVSVLADETRPYLQGARLTAWELHQSGIAVRVICDGSAGYWFGRGEITLSVVGADRIAVNGDVANKIGTYTVACLSQLHARPFYVAAPWSTVDLSCPTGAQIPIEFRDERELAELGFNQSGLVGSVSSASPERDAAELSRNTLAEGRGRGRGCRVVPEGVGVLNPAFDVTPAAYVTRIFTERGVLSAHAAGPDGRGASGVHYDLRNDLTNDLRNDLTNDLPKDLRAGVPSELRSTPR
jgi:methylthioribose-1-phosphate isomerase